MTTRHLRIRKQVRCSFQGVRSDTRCWGRVFLRVGGSGAPPCLACCFVSWLGSGCSKLARRTCKELHAAPEHQARART